MAIDQDQEGSDTCPECDTDLELEGYDFDVGETINCPECSVEIRIISVAPLLVVVADG